MGSMCVFSSNQKGEECSQLETLVVNPFLNIGILMEKYNV